MKSFGQSIGPQKSQAVQLRDRVILLPLISPPCENPWWRALGPDEAKDAAEPASWENGPSRRGAVKLHYGWLLVSKQ